MKLKQILFIALSGLISLAKADEGNAKSIVLKNGLKVIVSEKQDNDFVEFEVWYRTGSKDEKPGIRGMAHLFEHMMFRGTAKYPGKSVFDNVEKVGGRVNAYTSFDRTVYHEYVPVSALEKMMDIESDRMTNLVVTQEILNTEREVVGEELRNGTNSWYQKMNSDRYPFLYPKGHPYEVDVIGFLDEITKFTAPQCMEFYNNYYSPNNAYIVVAGNVKAEDVFAMAERYFGPITKQLDIKKAQNLPALDTAHLRTNEMNINFPVQIYTYTFARPAVSDPDFFGFQMLTDILFTGENSILNNRLVKKEFLSYGFSVAHDPWSYYPNLAIIDVIMNASPGNVKVKKAIKEEINKVVDEGISKELLDNYVQAYENSYVLNGYSCASICNDLGMAEYYFNDYRKAYTLSTEFKKITSDDMKRLAAKYLAEDKIQLVNIKPE
ncbi:MAG: peptidase M16-like protein [Bacteroidota bacterium]|jgi:predicted Zn-dependent peptidase|nr:peptidase M16-like protein [Bacteroidota bacterium]